MHNKIFSFGICMNKLFYSMMSGKPILYAVEAPNNFITDYNCGVSVKVDNVEALKEGLKQLLSSTEKVQMGKNGRQAVLKQ